MKSDKFYKKKKRAAERERKDALKAVKVLQEDQTILQKAGYM